MKIKMEMVSDPSVPPVTLEDTISLTSEWNIDRVLYRDLGSIIDPSIVLEDRFNDVLNARGFGVMIDSELIDFKFDTQYDSFRLYRFRSNAEFFLLGPASRGIGLLKKNFGIDPHGRAVLPSAGALTC